VSCPWCSIFVFHFCSTVSSLLAYSTEESLATRYMSLPLQRLVLRSQCGGSLLLSQYWEAWGRRITSSRPALAT
jgi:hypothetical protein